MCRVELLGAPARGCPRQRAAAGLSELCGTPGALQPVHRNEREGDLAALCHREGLSCIAYSALADGFLTGKYRPGQALPPSKRAEDAAAYLTDSGLAVLGALDSGRVERGADRGGGAGLAGRPTHGGRTASQCQDPQPASRPPASA